MLRIGPARQLNLPTPFWDHFRYNVLPSSLEPFRVALERMLIRDFAAAAVLTNKGGIDWRDISACCCKLARRGQTIAKIRGVAVYQSPGTSRLRVR